MAWRLTSPVSLKVKVIFWALPSWTASRLLGQRGGGVALAAEDQAAAGRHDQVAVALGGGSSAVLPVPGTVTDSRVWSLSPELKRVAETTAGPVDSRSGWVMTVAFCTWMSPTVVDALSGWICRVWRVVAGRARGERGEGDCEGGGGEGAASKAAAHGGGNSLTRAWATRVKPP
ncbi:hypothetical protein SALBM217S_00333 [Streptomyces griseoloalbus]